MRQLCFALVGFAAAITSVPTRAAVPVYCTLYRHPKPGEAIDARFAWISYAIVFHAYAEKACGAKHKSMAHWLLNEIQRQGCDPTTEAYRMFAETISSAEKVDLLGLVSGGDTSVKLTPSQLRKAVNETVKELGGCPKLVKWHAKLKE